jgi:hypothetical protein
MWIISAHRKKGPDHGLGAHNELNAIVPDDGAGQFALLSIHFL